MSTQTASKVAGKESNFFDFPKNKKLIIATK